MGTSFHWGYGVHMDKGWFGIWRGVVRRLGSLGLVAVLMLGLAACGGGDATETPETVKVAVIAPFSEPFAPLGRATRDGVVLAVEEWNQRGGVLGQRIEVILLDSGCDFETARTAAERAITQEGAALLIGAVCADASEAVAQVAMETGVLQVSPATVDPELTLDVEGETRPVVFRMGITDAAQGALMARFALETLDAETVAFLLDADSDYGRALATAFETVFTDEDGEVVARASYEADSETFYDVLEDVRAARPDVIYMPGYAATVSRVVGQARGFGVNALVLGSDGWDATTLDLAATEGCYFPSHYFPGDSRAAVRAWVQRFEARFLAAPDALATMGYDAATVLLSAVAVAETTDGPAVAEVMEATVFADVVMGPLRYDAAHDPIKPLSVLQVRAGTVVLAERVGEE